MDSSSTEVEKKEQRKEDPAGHSSSRGFLNAPWRVSSRKGCRSLNDVCFVSVRFKKCASLLFVLSQNLLLKSSPVLVFCRYDDIFNCSFHFIPTSPDSGGDLETDGPDVPLKL